MVENSHPEALRVFEAEPAYLRRDVKIEPLVDRWHAWPHLLAPAQQALNLAFRYLPIVHSFIAAPAVHAAASADPEMFGGPFLDLPASAIGPMIAYRDAVTSRRAEALAFAAELRDFNRLLQSETGYSLDEVRENLPQRLQGLTELVYDLNSHPKIRVLEEMFGECDFGHSDAQEMLIHTKHDVERPFFLSTPRVVNSDGLFLKAEFRSDLAKTLCGARSRPVDTLRLAKEIGCDHSTFATYFSTEPGGCAARYAGDGVRVRYFGHACLLIECRETAVMIDPAIANDQHEGGDHFTFEDLPEEIDVLFLSHGHQDHFSTEVLLMLRDRVKLVLVPPNNRGELSDPSISRMLRQLGYTNIRALEPLEVCGVLGGQITSLPFTGEHCDLDVHSKQCAQVQLLGRRIAIFVDTDAIDIGVYTRLAHRISEPDLMFVGMECFGAPLSWLYGPLISTPIPKRVDSSRRLSGANSQRARALAEVLRPKQAFVYAMGQEPWMRSMMGLTYKPDSIQLKESGDFIEWCKSVGIRGERLYWSREIFL